LEKRVHVGDPALLPPQVLVAYELPDSIPRRAIEIDDLPADWVARETYTRALGDQWLDSGSEVLLFVPSVIVPIASVPDRNVLINHRAAGVASIAVVHAVPFTLDSRLFKP
jgi:hypothetical protein